MEKRIDECEIEEEDIDQDSCFVRRERSFTSGSLSDVGKKRKQETVIEEICNELNQEEEKEPCNKRVKPVSRLKRFSQSFQRLSFRSDSRPAYYPSRPWGKNSPGSSKSRNSKLWSETFDRVSEELSAKEIKRQEAYFEPMLKLCIMSEEELNQIFGSLYSLIPLHQDLLSDLQRLQRADGTVFEVGPTLVEWLPSLVAYETYCCNQVSAKALLDYKKQQHRVDEFLRLCQESSFSRKLDLWNFLDLPRSRLVKYPLY
ncbi:rho guanine nucleotide exchange factor 3-like isoform X2 [Heptranchias perlo]|uniref:rho guanine nucleotide exchange factor 3-like isoform X2 n=1 Tax=Heptranchias perlo TaxID=212740 RepID=UPI00355AC44A